MNERVQLFCANGCSHEALDDALGRIMGGSWRPPERAGCQDEASARAAKQAAALRLWNGSDPAHNTPVQRYLETRGLTRLSKSAALRFRGDCRHPEGGWYAGMIALVQSASGQSIAVHRTYLARDGIGKAKAEPDRATLGPVWGGAVRLDPVAPEIAIGEGIESSASAGLLLGLPAWAALSAGNLAGGLVLPLEVRAVVIAADNDRPVRSGQRPGQEAAQAAATRWRAEGRLVRIATPDVPGCDFNDVLKARSSNA